MEPAGTRRHGARTFLVQIRLRLLRFPRRLRLRRLSRPRRQRDHTMRIADRARLRLALWRARRGVVRRSRAGVRRQYGLSPHVQVALGARRRRKVGAGGEVRERFVRIERQLHRFWVGVPVSAVRPPELMPRVQSKRVELGRVVEREGVVLAERGAARKEAGRRTKRRRRVRVAHLGVVGGLASSWPYSLSPQSNARPRSVTAYEWNVFVPNLSNVS